MNDAAEQQRGAPLAAGRVAGALAAFVVAVRAVRVFRPALLFGPEPSWLVVWLGMWIAVLAATAVAYLAVSRAVARFGATRAARAELSPLPFRPLALVLLFVAAVAAGSLLRLADLRGGSPTSLLDDLTLIGETRALSGTPADLARPLRAAPFGIDRPFATVGVLYLELSRWCLGLADAPLAGIRLPGALAGALSLLTGALLGRALLPRGGGALVALVLAGLRWTLIVSRWTWAVSIVVVPLVDVATLLLLRARRRGRPAFAALAGVVAGLGAHAYLVAWIAGAALLGWAAASSSREEPARRRAARAALFGAGFLLAAAPLLGARAGSDPPYFVRAGAHNVLSEMRAQKSVLPAFGAAADALGAPWFVPDPAPWGDLPGRSRTGPVLGLLLAVGLARALLSPRAELSSLLLAHALAGAASAVAQGESGNPNGYRYVYLTTPAALAIASGVFALLACVPGRLRRPAALALVGAVAVAGTLGARDALRWRDARSTFHHFRGCGALLGEAARRWAPYAPVTIDPAEGGVLALARLVDRWGLVRRDEPGPASPLRARASFRVALAPPAGGARVVERVVTPWNEPCGVVVLQGGRPP